MEVRVVRVEFIDVHFVQAFVQTCVFTAYFRRLFQRHPRLKRFVAQNSRAVLFGYRVISYLEPLGS